MFPSMAPGPGMSVIAAGQQASNQLGGQVQPGGDLFAGLTTGSHAPNQHLQQNQPSHGRSGGSLI
eukprot:scaffold651230_cov50-Prasinocladus_malaysianus.AAC.1